MTYQFKGYSWEELAECWGIEVTRKRVTFIEETKVDVEEIFGDTSMPVEPVYVTHIVNGKKVTFEVDAEEEVLAEKVKQFIEENVDKIDGEFKNPKIKEDILNFIKSLIKEGKYDFNTPIYEGMLKLENDGVLAEWIIRNLEHMWT